MSTTTDGRSARWEVHRQQRRKELVKVLHKLAFNPGDGKLRAQLTEAADVIGRIRAAHELAKTRKRANVQAIIDAYAAERFWGVREQMVTALADAQTALALEGLRHIVQTEKDPLVLGRVFRSAAKFRDASLAAAVRARIEAGGLAPCATHAAWLAVGAQR